jgi:hypothetical protein
VPRHLKHSRAVAFFIRFVFAIFTVVSTKRRGNIMASKRIGTRGKKQIFTRGRGRFMAVMLLAFFLAVAGCGAPICKDAVNEEAMDFAATSTQSAAFYNVEMPAGYLSDGEAGVGEAGETGNVVEAAVVGKRYLIQNARLTLEVGEVVEASNEIQLMVERLGGYVSSVEFYDLTQERRAGRLTLRIPEDKFRETLNQVKELGKAKNEHIYTDDVTMKYIDLEARLKNLEAQEQRMRDLLERAGNIEEILQIEKELGRIRGDLEAMTAEFKYLQEQVRFSTLDITLQEKDPHSRVVTGGFGNFGERTGNLLVLNTNRLFRGISNFLVMAIGSLPLLVSIVVLIFAAWKIKGFIKKKKTQLQKNKSSDLPS